MAVPPDILRRGCTVSRVGARGRTAGEVSRALHRSTVKGETLSRMSSAITGPQQYASGQTQFCSIADQTNGVTRGRLLTGPSSIYRTLERKLKAERTVLLNGTALLARSVCVYTCRCTRWKHKAGDGRNSVVNGRGTVTNADRHPEMVDPNISACEHPGV